VQVNDDKGFNPLTASKLEGQHNGEGHSPPQCIEIAMTQLGGACPPLSLQNWNDNVMGRDVSLLASKWK